MSKPLVLLVLLAILPAVTIAAAPPKFRDVMDQDVDRAIDEAKRFLYGQEAANGLWANRHGGITVSGQSALALLALLEAGENPADPRIQKGLQNLAATSSRNLYEVAVRVMVLSQAVAANKDSPLKAALEKDLAFLTKGAEKTGAWGYGGPELTGDNSCSQFALLALWEADRAGLEIKTEIVRQVERTWLRRQRKDGGWTYAATADAPSTVTMTTAALASLYLCQDVLSTGLAPYANNKAMDEAWKYLGQNLRGDFYNNGYEVFGLQRVGMSSGVKFVGNIDWFAAAAAKMVEPDPRGRQYPGEYTATVGAAFELIFLARSRLPMIFNKLDYGDAAHWNLYSRDVPRFTEHMRRKFELRLQWQVVQLADDLRQLLDAPILLVEGNAAVDFSDEQWQKLREYTLRGGTLLMVANNANKDFLESARKGLSDLYEPQRQQAGGHYQLEKLPADHPIYQGNTKIDSGPARMMLEGVSDGSRMLAILCPRDICRAWQGRTYATDRQDFALAENLYYHVTGANSLLGRMRPVFVPGTGEVRRKIRVAWLKHGGNWNTQPYALSYLSQKLTGENKMSLEVQQGVAISAEALNGFNLAWMTGTDEFDLGDAEVKALRDYLDGGGTLFINAVGGSSKFNASAKALLEKLSAPMSQASSEGPIMTGKCGEYRGPLIKSLARTRGWRTAEPSLKTPAVMMCEEKDRPIVIYAPYGIHDTLDGHAAHGMLSYMPNTARELAANIVLTAIMTPASPAASQPTTKPAAAQ